MGHDPSIDTDLDPPLSGRFSITAEVQDGSPFTIGSRACDRDDLRSAPQTRITNRRQSPRAGNTARAVFHRAHVPGHSGRPCVWLIRCYVNRTARRFSADHPVPRPSLPGRRTRPTLEFVEPHRDDRRVVPELDDDAPRRRQSESAAR